ncbi:MAG TPA: 16S rRNA (adenine(1518)-N(6)/adenine(1519)-N(6))-dimethyltransferase RsmA [Sphaerochaeta sp.]|jgi:16S rRNA (adenine1518-N6/adenine1519-N6)-dimethyltransferase|nr:16S rRNA (adenine(1518)-N(6)/adenine(1519)-N(6))-dimethyltransferase RsmA [Sphaerochaeta sp.]HPZ15062.1 16S rRNA (adenine(1518)-N(6)/adenine(1519)-N(6))-dimethyltransferase RsmA [Sphaerochaeta sp.]
MREKIVSLLSLEAGQRVLEIGPGIGSITTLLLDSEVALTAFEIDHGFCHILREEAFGTHPNFTLVEGDALKTLFAHLKRHGTPDRICGNLPYNVGTILVARLLESEYRPPLMVYTLQKEVADRLTARERSKEWSALSLLAQTDYDIVTAATIAPGAFYPPPKVESSVVLFTKREVSRVEEHLRQSFVTICRDLFAMRRKTILNNVKSGKSGAMIGKEGVAYLFEASGVDPTLRAEALTWDDFLALSSALYNYRASGSDGMR